MLRYKNLGFADCNLWDKIVRYWMEGRYYVLFAFSGEKKGGKERFLYAYTEVNATDSHPTHVSRGGGVIPRNY